MPKHSVMVKLMVSNGSHGWISSHIGESRCAYVGDMRLLLVANENRTLHPLQRPAEFAPSISPPGPAATRMLAAISLNLYGAFCQVGRHDLSNRPLERRGLAIPSFFEIKESGGVRNLSEKNRICFFEACADCKLERGKRTRESPIQIT